MEILKSILNYQVDCHYKLLDLYMLVNILDLQLGPIESKSSDLTLQLITNITVNYI